MRPIRKLLSVARGIKVLVVDDDADVLDTVVDILESEYDVVTESNPITALETVRRISPQVAIIDYMMPDRNGLELVQLLTTLYPNTATILLTAYGTSRVESHGTTNLGAASVLAGAVRYVDKAQMPELPKIVSAVIAARRRSPLRSLLNKLRSAFVVDRTGEP